MGVDLLPIEPELERPAHDRADCVFCNLADYPEESAKYEQVLHQSRHFFVVPALGAFCEGYVLICPREHYLNLGRLSDRLFAEFLALKEQVRSALKAEFGQRPVFFEHGPARFFDGAGACVDHAHLHCLPVELSSLELVMSKLKGGQVSSHGEIRRVANALTPYFYFEYSGGAPHVFEAPDLPCQFGRRILAKAAGVPKQWNWRNHPNHERMMSTVNRLEGRLNG